MSGEFERERWIMTDSQIRARGVSDPQVLAAMEKIPRHLFVPSSVRGCAHADEPLPIGDGQTISQPYIVAYMTEALALRGGEQVLEVGTGSGYQTAVLAEIAGTVFTVEIVEKLALRARAALDALGYSNVRYRVGDGSAGWAEEAPFDAIMVTAAAARMPEMLEDQLAVGGRMIVPVGDEKVQRLRIIRKRRDHFGQEEKDEVTFVPLLGRFGRSE